MPISSARNEVHQGLEERGEKKGISGFFQLQRMRWDIDRESAVYQGNEAKSDRSSRGILEKSRLGTGFESMMLQWREGELYEHCKYSI